MTKIYKLDYYQSFYLTRFRNESYIPMIYFHLGYEYNNRILNHIVKIIADDDIICQIDRIISFC
jgi:hypothetical protein